MELSFQRTFSCIPIPTRLSNQDTRETMHSAHFFIACMSCMLQVTNAQVIYDKAYQSPAITSVLGYIAPGNTTEIYFDDNSITHVPSGYFISLPDVDKIDLSSNVISLIDHNAFNGVPSVTKIYLDDNQLTIIHTLTFAGLPNLSKLYLNSNRIVTIETGSFYDNAALTLLWLYNNDLETFPQCIFNPAHHPAALNLLRIYSNPLQCNDTLCWLKYAEAASWITVFLAESTQCAGPPALESRTWDTLNTTDLNCGPPGE